MQGFTWIALVVVGFIAAKFAVFLYLNERKLAKTSNTHKKQS